MNTRIKLGKVQAIVVVASLLASFFVGFASPAKADDTSLLITGVVDGPLTGGVPKAVEFYVLNDIADLSIYGFGSANNGGGSDGEEFTFPAVAATAGTFIYVASETIGFTDFFEFAPDYTGGAASINGDDAIELFQNGSVVDVFGDINVDGTGEPWEYMDGWAYRVNETGPDGDTFVLANWSFSGPNALDGETTNATAATPFPIGTYLPGSGPDYTPIYDIQYTTDPSGDSPYKDQVGITTEGIVTAIFDNGYFTEDPAGGAWNGLWVYDSNTPALGDRVRLTGTVEEYYNLTELKDLTSYDVVSSGNPLPGPVVLATSDVSQEQWESVLVRVENVTVTNDDLGYGEWSVSDGSGDVRIDDKGSYTYAPSNGDAIDAIIGPLDYSYSNFKIQPRNDDDIILPAAVEIVITEIMQNPAAVDDSVGEWFEIYNAGDAAVDLSDWTVSDAGSDSFTIAGPLTIAPDEYLVLGRNGDTGTNGGVEVDYVYNSFTLGNSDDEIIIEMADSAEVDRVEYDGGPVWPDPTGASMMLTDVTLDNSVGDNWQATPEDLTYGDGDRGTPGCPNTGCVLDYIPIYDIQYTTDPSGDSPYKDQVGITTEGIVTAIFDNGYFTEDPAGGAWNGLWVYDDSNTPALGDRVRLTGTVEEYYNLTELKDLTSYDVLSSGNPLPGPVFLATGDVSQEQWEGVLVHVENVTVTNDNLGYGEWSVSDSSGDVRVDDKGSYTYTPTNGDAIDAIIGPLDYSYSNFKIQPRDDADIILPAPPSALVINEILADPDATNGDANGDGTVNTTEDEFVEIVNNSDSDVDISGWTLADGYTVRHTFPADTVVSANCAIVVFGGGTPTGSFGNAVVQTASTGSLGLNNSGDTVTLNDGVTDQAVVTYDSEGGDNQSLTRDPDITGSFVKHSTATGSGGALFSPGTMIDGSSFPGCGGGFGVCGDPATFIHDIQGNGDVSPLNGASDIIIEGVVVGDFQDTSTELSGFFLQEEDGDADADPMTSEGIFIYDYGFMDVNVGDVVRVMGDVTEYYELTELNNVSGMLICDPGPVATAAAVTLPIADTAEWEWYEGMLINIPGPLYATGNYSQGRYGEVDLSINDRLDNPTNVVAPGTPANDLQELNDRSRIQLEDGSTLQNPVPAPYIGDGNTLRAGDTIPELTGVLHYGFGSYELHPTGAVNFTRVNTRDATPPDVGGTLKVASFNVLNYFTTLDDSGPICGPSGGLDCRGADTAEEFTRQRDKIIAAIITMDADVIGLMEMENHPTDDALQDLVNGLNDAAGAGTYALINTGTIGTDAIKVAFIYKIGTVTPVGPFAILDSSVDPLFLDTKNRPALAQTFEQNATGETFTAVVNHLKSKGSPCDDVGDPDMGDGQGNCNQTRTNAAIALANWLATDPTGSGDSDFLIIGDLNAYAMEDPITAIKDAGYTNLIETLVGADAYSYVFYGQAGYLDHSLASASLTDQVTGVVEWHINADEPAALNYNDYNQPELYNPDAYRASDHDPVIVGLALQPETVPFETFKIRYASIRWKGQKCADGYFTILGQLELPEGYTRDDLTRDLELMLTIKGEDADDTVTMKERRRVWYYHGKLDHPIEGLQLTKALILWPRPGDSRPPIFTLRGAFSMPGVDHKTRPAEAIVNLSLPVANAQLAEQVVGEKLVKFRTYHRLWLYSPWLKRAKIYVHDLPR